MTVRTRFAPSPTGYLHIGGARTALFAWLFARRHGGKFVLRIDDTDAERNRPEALAPILEGFRWLGLDWDEGPEVGGDYGPYYQSQRLELYRQWAERLIESGHAYPSYETKEELDALRKQAEQEKRNFVFRGRNRDADPQENLRRWREEPAALRFKVPRGQTVVLDDLIRGHVEWQTDLIGDPVIVRPNGLPLYNFATVVDDASMRITHVIRAAEHLSNTAVQVLLFEALGEPLPRFAHVPVVNEPNSSKKLSKRRVKQFITPEVREKLHLIGYSDQEIDSRDDLNPVTVSYYKELGYLPQALVNYLGRLGWSLDDKTEIMSIQEMIEHFSLDRVNDAPASFDPQKLLWMAGEYMNRLDIDKKLEGCLPYLLRAGLLRDPVSEADRDKLKQVILAAGHRLRIFSDILIHARPFFLPEPEYNARSVEKRLKKPEARELLVAFKPVLAGVEPFSPERIEAALDAFCEERGVKKNLLIHALRVAVTGSEVGLGLYDTLAIFGREEVLRRIDLGLQQS